jgi:RNA polymerase sigma-32 factor
MKKVQQSSPEPPMPHLPPDSDVEILETEDQHVQDLETTDDFENDVPVIDVGDEEEEEGVPQDKRLPIPADVRDNLHLYLREVSRFPLLKPDEEQRLARRVREHNDSEAAFQLISSHLRLVVKIAMDFQRRWMQNVLDLIQEGNEIGRAHV